MTIANAQLTRQLFTNRTLARREFGDDYLAELASARDAILAKVRGLDLSTSADMLMPDMLLDIIDLMHPPSVRSRLILEAAAAEILPQPPRNRSHDPQIFDTEHSESSAC